MKTLSRTVLLLLCHSYLSFGWPDYDHGIDLPTTQPLIIAHRGASGIYPEHTAEAYQLAIDQGTDIIECDVCVTNDLRLVCLHESWLSESTNVADVFPEDRMNTYHIYGVPITDYFSVDFTLEELKTLRMRQRIGSRDDSYDDLFSITTVNEYIDIARNSSRTIGLYPETKDPSWVNKLEIITQSNTSLEELLLDTLHARGYTDATDPCFLQSFHLQSVLDMLEITSLPLIPLLDAGIQVTDDDLDYYSTFAYGIGVHKELIVRVGVDNTIREITDLVDRAHSFGLRVHAFTARNEYQYLPFDYEQDPYLEYQTLLSTGTDGIFSDFPATYKRYLQHIYCENCNSTMYTL